MATVPARLLTVQPVHAPPREMMAGKSTGAMHALPGPQV